MEKTATLNLRVNPDVKKQAEEVLDRLGIPMSTVIYMYLNQIGMTQGIPFAVTIPKAPMSINADALSADEIQNYSTRAIGTHSPEKPRLWKLFFQISRKGTIYELSPFSF